MTTVKTCILSSIAGMLSVLPVVAETPIPEATKTPGKTALEGILVELDKPLPTPIQPLRYECKDDGIKQALGDLIKLGYKTENLQRQIAGKQQRMINDLEKAVKLAAKDPAAGDTYDAVEKQALAYADELDGYIKSIGNDYGPIRQVFDGCHTDKMKDNRAAADYSRRVVAFDQILPKLREQPGKLRESLAKARETFKK